MITEGRYRNFEIGYEACYYVSTLPTKGSKGKSEVSELKLRMSGSFEE